MLPVLERLLYRPASAAVTRVLVLVPTRELGVQVYQVTRQLAQFTSVEVALSVGGLDLKMQESMLRKNPDIVIATPGRLIDHIKNTPSFGLESIEVLILDEADRMLDQGFERDIRQIIGETHPARQTALFSATWPDSVRELAHSFLSRPIKVTIGSDDLAAGTRITQIVEVVEDRARELKLQQLLKKYHADRKNRILIFALYKKEAARLETNLSRGGWVVTSIHGDKSQEGRTKAVEQFKSGEVPLLVATDVAARGLDIPGVDFVINYSFPLTIEDYVHR